VRFHGAHRPGDCLGGQSTGQQQPPVRVGAAKIRRERQVDGRAGASVAGGAEGIEQEPRRIEGERAGQRGRAADAHGPHPAREASAAKFRRFVAVKLHGVEAARRDDRIEIGLAGIDHHGHARDRRFPGQRSREVEFNETP